MKINRDVSFIELQKLLLKQMSAVLKPETFSYSTPINEMFKIHLQEPSADPGTYLESKFEHPLLTEMIDLAISVHPSDSGPAHIKLSLEWTDPEKFFSEMEDHFVEHESVTKVKDTTAEENSLTLEHCLDHYTKAETLSAEDAWRCPRCCQYLPVVKTLGLWSLPDILVIHFKRFRQQQLKGSQASKLTTMVKFPLTGFDLSTWHLSNGSFDGGTASMNSSLSRKAAKPTSKSGTLTKTFMHEDHRYDLYAVCYHQGDTLETGHYTAACKNPYDQQWYKFDDQRVSLIKHDEVPDKIINNEAYMLFYQRRKLNENSDSSGASTSSSDHWVSKIVTTQSSANATLKTTAPVKVQEPISTPPIVDEKAKEVEVIPPPVPPAAAAAVAVVSEPEIKIEAKNVEEKKELEAILNIDDIKAIDGDDIPEVVSSTETINHEEKDEEKKTKEGGGAETNEHSVKTDNNQAYNKCNGHHDESEEENKKENSNSNDDDDEEEESIVERKIEVKVEISASSPLPEPQQEDCAEALERNERDKIEDLMSQHKISNLLWNDQNNNSTSNRHSDIGAITISDLLLMDRIEDISSTSLPKNYMLHDTERITNRIRGVSSCSKDTLLYIDQQSLLEDDSLLENRSHWVSLGLLNV
jgi:ubiquitin carboxyl-terminal hydrolase 31